MTPFMSLLLPIVVSAVAVFVLTLIIHMTPWHKSDYIKLPDEDDVMKALRPFTIPSNDYMVPHPGSGADMKHAVFHHVAVITFLTYAMGAVPMSIWYHRKWSTTFKTAMDSLLYVPGAAGQRPRVTRLCQPGYSIHRIGHLGRRLGNRQWKLT